MWLDHVVYKIRYVTSALIERVWGDRQKFGFFLVSQQCQDSSKGAPKKILSFAIFLSAFFCTSVLAVQSTNDGSWKWASCAALNQAEANCQTSMYAVDPRVCEVSGSVDQYGNHNFIVGLWDWANRGGASWPGGSSGTCAAGSNTASPNKTNGVPSSPVGDPIDAGTGNTYRNDEDFRAGRWLTFARYYNSNPSTGASTFGPHWLYTYARYLSYAAGSIAGTGTVNISHEDGEVTTYALLGGVWVGESDIADTLTEQVDANGNPTAWSLKRADTLSTENTTQQGS
jgi:hypothetical protein